jgi:hypothetical protein
MPFGVRGSGSLKPSRAAGIDDETDPRMAISPIRESRNCLSKGPLQVAVLWRLSTMRHDILTVGAGLTGLVLALWLTKLGPTYALSIRRPRHCLARAHDTCAHARAISNSGSPTSWSHAGRGRGALAVLAHTQNTDWFGRTAGRKTRKGSGQDRFDRLIAREQQDHRLPTGYHLPICDPPSTWSISPVTCGASDR